MKISLFSHILLANTIHAAVQRTLNNEHWKQLPILRCRSYFSTLQRRMHEHSNMINEKLNELMTFSATYYAENRHFIVKTSINSWSSALLHMISDIVWFYKLEQWAVSTPKKNHEIVFIRKQKLINQPALLCARATESIPSCRSAIYWIAVARSKNCINFIGILLIRSGQISVH